MFRILILASFLASALAAAQDTAEEKSAQPVSEQSTPAEKKSNGVKTLSGMSILGNEEAPKSLVIVPWKSSRLGDGIGVTNEIDGSPRPVDKEVFMREVHYYDLRSGVQD